MVDAAAVMPAVIFPHRNSFAVVAVVCLLFWVFSVATLAGQRYDNYRYNYSIWPPSFWERQQGSDDGATALWRDPQKDLTLQARVSGPYQNADLQELRQQTLVGLQGKATQLHLEGKVADWLQGLLAVDATIDYGSGRAVLVSWSAVQRQRSGWLLLCQSPQAYYQIIGEGPLRLTSTAAALLLSAVDSFALLGTMSWHPGVASLIQRRHLRRNSKATDSVLPYSAELASWTALDWHVLRQSGQLQSEREFSVLQALTTSNYRPYGLKRYYYLLVRNNFYTLQPLLKLIAATPRRYHSSQFATAAGQQELVEPAAAASDNVGSLDSNVTAAAAEPAVEDDELDIALPGAAAAEDYSAAAAAAAAAADWNPFAEQPAAASTAERTAADPAIAPAALKPANLRRQQLIFSLESQDQDSDQESTAADNSSSVDVSAGSSAIASAALTATSGLTKSLTPSISAEQLLQLLYNLQGKKAQQSPVFPSVVPALLADFWHEQPNLEALLLTAATMLSQLGYSSILMFSYRYQRILLGVEIAGEGARVSWNGRSYLLIDLGHNLRIGWVPQETADLQYWQAIQFPSWQPLPP